MHCEKGTELTLLYEETEILQLLQQTPGHVLCGGVLGSCIKNRDAYRLDKVVRNAGPVAATELESLTSVVEKRTELKSNKENKQHLYTTPQPAHSYYVIHSD